MTSRNRPCDNWILNLSLHLDEEALDPEAVEEHLRSCPACRVWFAGAKADRDRVRQAFAVPIPPGFAERILIEAQRTQPSALRRPLGSIRCQRIIEIVAAAAIVALLVAFVGPLAPMARQSLRTRECLQNVRELASALQAYSDDYGETLPPGQTWDSSLVHYVRGLGTYQCPEAKSLPSYCFEPGLSTADIRGFEQPSQVIVFYDEREQHPGVFDPRHNGMGATAFLDGTASMLPALPPEAEPVRPESEVRAPQPMSSLVGPPERPPAPSRA
jgi:hypothetical protein